MATVKDNIAMVYEMVLSTPGMNDHVKIGLSLPRKTVFLLVKAVERGLSDKTEDGLTSGLNMGDQEVKEQLQGISFDLLHKAGLTELFDKLKALK